MKIINKIVLGFLFLAKYFEYILLIYIKIVFYNILFNKTC